MNYQDTSSLSGTDARSDTDVIPAGSKAPAVGNTITGAGTVTGASGADVVGTAPGNIVAVQGAGGSDTSDGGAMQVSGRYGVLNMDSDGSYRYTRNGDTPDGVRDVFTYTLADAGNARDTATLTIDIGREPIEVKENAQQVVVGPDGVVTLPEGVTLADINVVGRNLVINLPDGGQMVIIDGAVFVPQLVLGGVEVPSSNLAALLVDNEPVPAAGNPQSSGGNFGLPPGPLDPGVPLGDLIPPVEQDYTPPDFEDVGQFIDDEPEIFVQPDGQPAAISAIDSVDERGLPSPRLNGANEPAGSGESADGNGANGSDSSETTTGTIIVDANDTPVVLTITGFSGGTQVVAVGLVVQGQYGTLTITGVSGSNYTYSYTLRDNTSGNTTADNFSLALTDNDGDVASATLRIDIVDDVPTARPDTDSIAAGQFGPATGNVITDAAAGDAGDSDTNAADTVGADNAAVTSVSSVNVAANSDSTFATVAGFSTPVLQVNGQYGVLTINASGDYSYARNPNTPGGVTDTFNYTITDGDTDTSSSTLTISIGDIGVTVTPNAIVRTDDDAVPNANGNPGGPGDDVDAANLTGTLSGSGGDGALTFDLLLTGAPAGFTYVDGANGSVLVQQVQNGTTVTVLTVTINSATGAYTVTQNAPILHPTLNGVDGDNTENNQSFTINYTVTDLDNDSAAGTLTIDVDDDTPTVTVRQVAEEGVVLQTQDADTIGAASDTDSTSANFAGVFSATASLGADGGAAAAFSYSLAVLSASSGLTSHGVGINLYNVGGVIIGSTAASAPASANDPSVVFTVAVNGSGVVTLTHMQQIDHTNPDPSPTEAEFADHIIALADGKISLTATGTATDADGDTASDSETVDLGGNITFADHGPSISNVTAGASVTLDETTAAPGNNPGSFPISAESSGAVVSATQVFGADGAAAANSVVYGLALKGGVSSLLSNLETAVGGHDITLVLVDANTIEGRYTDGGTQVAFVIEMDTADGSITVTQNVPLEHLTDGPPGPAHDDALDLDDLVEATITIKDFDGDTADGSAPIGDNIVFRDDGPSITVTQTGEGSVVLQTQDDDTIGAATDSDASTANFSGVFGVNASGGADGTASVNTSYSLAVLSAVSGLTSHGVAVNLYNVSGVIIGSTALSAPASAADASVVFTVSVSAGGVVTLNQMQQIDHTNLDPSATGPGFEDHIIALADGKISLTATSTITDNDGDTATASDTLDLGGNITFADDGPDIAIAQTNNLIKVDETDGVTTGAEVDPVGGNLGTVTVSAAVLYTVSNPHVSADAPTTYGYALTLGTPGQNGLVNSGLLLSTTNAPIYLYKIDGVVVGSTALSAPATVNDPSVVFTVSINASGDITLTQILAVEHGDPTLPDEDSSGMILDALGVTVTATDFDGDTDQATIDIGSRFRFEDDAPTIDVTQTGAGNVLLTTQDAQTIGNATDSDATAINFAGVFGLSSNGGSDGAANTPSLSYSLQVVSGVSGLTSGGVAVNLYLVDGVVIGSTALSAPASTADASVVFAISVNSSGVVTLQQMQQIDHTNADPSATGGPLYDDHLIALADGKVTLTATASITDNDGDVASNSEIVDLGGNIRFADDGPDARPDSDAIAPGFFGIADGNVLTGVGGTDTFGPDGVADIAGADAPIRVSAITFGATTLAVTAGGSQVIDGTYGQLTIYSDGRYSYDRFDGSAGGSSDIFTYTIVDYDGDTDTATLTINIGINPPVATTGSASVDDDGLVGSPNGIFEVGVDDINANTFPLVDDLDGAASSEASFRGVLGVTGGDGAITFSFLVPAGQVDIGQETVTFTPNGDGTLLTATIATSPDATRVGDPLFTVSLNKATGEYTVTLVDNVLHDTDNSEAEDGSEVQLTIQYQVTDAGNSSSALPGNLTITFNDDTPRAAIVENNEAISLDESVGNQADSDDVTGPLAVFNAVTTKGTDPDLAGPLFATEADPIVSSTGTTVGADGGTISFGLSVSSQGVDSGLDTTDGTSIYLFKEGDLVVGRAGADSATAVNGPAAFAFAISATGQLSMVEYMSIRHPTGGLSSPDESVTLAEGLISATVSVTDADGDTSVASTPIGDRISFQDSAPVITAAQNINIQNSGDVAHTGQFAFNLGADGAATNNDVITAVTGSATVGGVAVTNWVLTPNVDAAGNPSPETAATASYRFTFNYPIGGGSTAQAVGTLVFNKDLGTYTVDLVNPIQGVTTILQTAQGTLFQGYEYGTSNLDGSQPEISVTQIQDLAGTANDIYVQFTGVAEPSSGTGDNNLEVSNWVPGANNPAPVNGGGDTDWNAGQLFNQVDSWVSTSNSANGVAGDTIQGGEVLDFSLVQGANPTGVLAAPGTYAQASAMFLKFDGIGSGEDMIVILKLYDPTKPPGEQYTTRAIMVENGDIQKGPGAGPGQYSGVTLDNNDGLVIIEANDYNLPGENWVIVGAQVAGSDEGVAGTAINLNSGIGASGDSITGNAFDLDPDGFQSDTNDGPFKISSIGFLTTSTTPQNAQLDFNVTVTDGDGDSITQSITATVTAAADSASNATIPAGNTTVSMEAPSSKLYSNSTLEQQQAANSNTVLLGAIAGAGLMSASAAAAAPSMEANAAQVDNVVSQSSLASAQGTWSVDHSSSGLIGHAPIAAQGGEFGAGRMAFRQDSHSSEGLTTASAEAPAVSALSQGNDVPAASQEAPAASFAGGEVAMPSLEALAASVAQQGGNAQAEGDVAQVLADALAGGGGVDIDGLLASLPGNGGNAADALASHDMAAVSAWHSGAFGGFSASQQAFTMESLVLHQDAVVQQA